jgi:tripartite-type tricarboxylate transporter receptor subunit TctC
MLMINGEKNVKKIKQIIIILVLAILVVHNVSAKDIDLIVPNTPGSQTDMLAKSFSTEYQKKTGEKVNLIYAPGGSGAVAAVLFQKSHNRTLLFGIASMIVYEPVLKENLPYADKDFKYVAWFAQNSAIYISNSNSGINSMDDVIHKLPISEKPFVGGYTKSFDLSVTMLNKSGKLKKPLEIVGHKGAPETVLSVLNGSIDVGLVAVTNSLFQLADEGRIKLLGNTSSDDLKMENYNIISVSKKYGIPQTMGGFSLIMKPDADKKFTEEFFTNSRVAINSQEFQDLMKKLLVISSGVHGEKETTEYIKQVRQIIKDTIK